MSAMSAQDRVLADALSSAPAYVRLYVVLVQEIGEAGLADWCLPSQRSLARRFDVSISTVKGAVKLLRKDGLLGGGTSPRPGSVQPELPATLETLRSWSRTVARPRVSVPAGETAET